jgi:hypothetical protein
MLKYLSLLPLILVAAAPLAHAQVDTETPEQHTYEGRMDRDIRSWIHEGNRAVTPEERSAVTEHWRRAARLWRIRKLAAAAHDMASVRRADALLARADKILEKQIGRFRSHAPVLTEAPPMVEVTQAPPPPRAETRPLQPSPHAMWVPGFWAWDGHRHAWNAGRWAEPPQQGMTWEAPKWENHGGKWGFHEGRWRAAAPAPNVVYEPPPAEPEVTVPTPPPPPVVEVRPPQPPKAVWIPGYWHWNGRRHVWVGGRWSAPKPGMKWQPDHWEHTGRGWHMVHGHWSH